MRGWRAAPWALALAMLSGCSGVTAALPRGQELENTVLMQCLGVDMGTQRLDGVAVTASSGGRPAAGESPGQEPVVLSAQAETITAATAQMQGYGDDFVFFGDVEQVLIGQGQAQRGIQPVLDHLAKDPELRLEAQVWAVKGGSAGDVLFSAADTSGAAARLRSIQDDASELATAVSRTARSALADLLDNGCTFVPGVALAPAAPGDGSQGETALVPAGYAVFRDGALAGWAEGEAALGVNLLLGEDTSGVLELCTPQQGRAALRIERGSASVEPVFRGDTLVGLKVRGKVEAAVTEYRGEGGLTQEVRDWLEAALARAAARRLEAALELGQGLDADFLHLERRCALAQPWRKAELERQWDGAWKGLALDVEVEAGVARE